MDSIMATNYSEVSQSQVTPTGVTPADMDAFATYKEFAGAAAATIRFSTFPQFFAPRPAPMTLTLAR